MATPVQRRKLPSGSDRWLAPFNGWDCSHCSLSRQHEATLSLCHGLCGNEHPMAVLGAVHGRSLAASVWPILSARFGWQGVPPASLHELNTQPV